MSRHRFLRRTLVAGLALAALFTGMPPVEASPAGKSVLLVHSLPDAQRDDVVALLEGVGFTVVAFDASAGTPTAAALAAHDAALVASNDALQDPALLGDRLADHVDDGGHVVLTLHSFNCMVPADHPQGRFQSQGYTPLAGEVGCLNVFGESSLTKVQAQHPLLADVGSFSGGTDSRREDVALTGTSLLVAEWADGLPLVARNRTPNAIGGVVALNMRPVTTASTPSSWDADTSDGVELLVNALLDARPIVVTPAGFPDVASNAFYAAAVDWAKSAAVTTGFGTTGQFRPDEPVDRGQMAAFLHRTMDRLAGSPPSGFPDVPANAFYTAAVNWARATGVTDGFGNTGLYAPAEVVTRGQMVTFLHRIAGQPGPHGPHGFPDVAGNAFYESAVRWAKATGVTDGFGDTGEFRPDEPVTRGQMVTFLNRLASTPSAWGPTTQIPTTARF